MIAYPTAEPVQSMTRPRSGSGETERTLPSVCLKLSEIRIQGVCVDVGSTLVPGHLVHEELLGFWYKMPKQAQETRHFISMIHYLP